MVRSMLNTTSSSSNGGSSDTQEMVDQSSRATRGARPAGSLARRNFVVYLRALTRSLVRLFAHALPLPLYLSSCFLSSSPTLPIAPSWRSRARRLPGVKVNRRHHLVQRRLREREDEGGFAATTKRRGRENAAWKTFFGRALRCRTSVRAKVRVRAFPRHSPNTESASERNHVLRTNIRFI